MKVLFDSTAYDYQNYGGVSRCMFELYAHLPEEVEAEIAVKATYNAYLLQADYPSLDEIYRSFITPYNFFGKYALYKLYYAFRYKKLSRWNHKPLHNRYLSVKKLKKGDFDIFHPTFFDPYFLKYIGKKPFVLTIHDMIPERFPQYFSQDNPQIVAKKKLIPLAAHLIAVSQQTKEDLMRLMNIPEEKITVVYHGADESPYVPGDNLLNTPYLLYVGERGLYKNFLPFFKDCEVLLKKHPELSVICTGRPFNKDEQRMIKDAGLTERVVHRWVDTKQEMYDLYHYATAFVYPSEYEGFGIPILEAYKADCPVMLNRASCFPEVAGEAAVYFNMSTDGSNFVAQFETLYHQSETERAALITRQRERLKKYAWSKAAKELADVYKKLV